MANVDIAKSAEIDPEFAAAWEKIGPNFPDLGGDVHGLRKVLAAGKKALADAQPDAGKGVEEKDIQVRGRGGHDIPVRVYSPVSPPSGGSPLVVLMHGGGFVLGDIESDTALSRLFVKHLGCTCVAIDYRLAPENPFPAAPNDCWDATKWAAQNAQSLGADPSKGFIVGGTSAGGNLCDVTAHTAREQGLTPPITGLLEMVPVLTSPSRMSEKYKDIYLSRKQNEHAPVLPRKTMDSFESNYQPDHTSPLYDSFNNPRGHKGIANKVYFAVCGMDPLRDDATVYEKVLREEYEIPTKFKLYPGMPHSFWSFLSQLPATNQFLKDTVEAMRWLLE